MTVEQFLVEFSKTGKFPDEQVASKDVRDFLEELGMKETISVAGQSSLRKYTNLGKSSGLREVWGEKFNLLKNFAVVFVQDYEQRTGIKLPALGNSGKKTSGLIALFGEMTAYAHNAMSWEDFKKYSEARWLNGALWEQGRKDERIRVDVPTSSEPIRLSSYPPEYPQAMLDFMKRGFRLI